MTMTHQYDSHEQRVQEIERPASETVCSANYEKHQKQKKKIRRIPICPIMSYRQPGDEVYCKIHMCAFWRLCKWWVKL